MLKSVNLFFVVVFSCLMVPAVSGASGTDVRNLLDTIPEQWNYTKHFNQEMPENDKWWNSFSDTLLDSLINEGTDANYDIVMAARRIEIARQQMLSARSAYLPTVGLEAGWAKSRTSGDLGRSTMTPAVVSDYFSLGLNMQWEIDVFGKIRAKSGQQKELYRASRAEYAAAMVALCARQKRRLQQLVRSMTIRRVSMRP